RFGLVLQGSIRGYMDTGQKILVKKIRSFLDSKEGLKGIKLSNDEKYIEEACVLGFRMDEKNKPIFRLFSVEQVKSGLPRDTKWQLGYPKKKYYNKITGKITYTIIPQVIITNKNGHILRNQYGLLETDYFIRDTESGIYQLKDYGERWCAPEKNLRPDGKLKKWYRKNILKDYRGIEYGYKMIFYELTRHGNYYNILGHELDLTSMKLKFNLDRDYNADRFKDKSFESREYHKKLDSLPHYIYYKEYPFSAELEGEISELKDEILLPILNLARRQIEFKPSGPYISEILAINNKLLKVLNSYIDENGIMHKGNGYNEINYLFKNLIGEDRAKIVSFNAYYSNAKNPGKNNLKFNRRQSDKDWGASILDAFQSYEPPDCLTDETLIELNEKILKWKAIFFKSNGEKRTFSDGPFLKEYTFGTDEFEDETLIKELKDAVIDTFGRFTFYKMITGGLFFEGDLFHFITLSWNSYRDSFMHNNRLQLDFFSVPNNPLNFPPTSSLSSSSLPYAFYSIIFSPSWNLRVIKEPSGAPKDVVLRTPHIPTDNWNPSFISDRDIINRLGEDGLIPYTSFLCTYLSKVLDINAPVIAANFLGRINSRDGTRILLDYIMYKFKQKDEIKKYTGEKKNYYLSLVEANLYKLLFLGQSQEFKDYRREIMDFLRVDIDKITIKLKDLISASDIPDIFKSIDLNKADQVYWRENGFDALFIRSLRINTKTASDLKPSVIINSLKEPISRLSNALRNLAIKYARSDFGNPKKLYIIPLKEFSHGRTQPASRGQHDKYLKVAKDKIIINGIGWYCWELDGTNEVSLKKFSDKYKYMLWCLLEGRLSFSIVARDEVTGNIEHVDTFNILCGALKPNQIIPSINQRHYKEIRYANEYAEPFFEEINSVMRDFKQVSLPFVLAKKDTIELYDFIF
ncbi:MAG: hypothetical protein ACTSQJ_04130, partial [Promethearchaeota archaeon]